MSETLTALSDDYSIVPETQTIFNQFFLGPLAPSRFVQLDYKHEERARKAADKLQRKAQQARQKAIQREIDPVEREKLFKKLKTLTQGMESFYMNDIAPISLAFNQSLENVTDKLGAYLGQDLSKDSIAHGRMQSMLLHIVNLKMIDYLCTQLKLNATARDILLRLYESHRVSHNEQTLQNSSGQVFNKQ